MKNDFHISIETTAPKKMGKILLTRFLLNETKLIDLTQTVEN